MLNRALIILSILLLPAMSFAAKTVFVDGNKAIGQRGTVVTSAFLNGVNNHRHDGGAYDGAGVLDYYQDSGSANSVVITPNPALASHVTGMPIYVKVAAANTGATTLTVGSLPAVSIKRADGTALHPGDLSSGLMIIVAYDGASYRMLAPTRDSAQLNGKSWVNKVNNLLVSAVANNSLHPIPLNPGGQHNFYRYSVYGVAPGGAYVGTIHGYMTGTVPYVTLTQGSSGTNDTLTIWNNFGSSLDFYVTVDSWE